MGIIAAAGLVLAAVCIETPAREIVVDAAHPQAADTNPGTPERPLKTVAKAAAQAEPGDTVLVGPGVYREYVRLTKSGTAAAPIVIQARTPGKTVLTGADVIKGWARVPGDAPIWRADWPHVFAINHANGKPVEHHPGDAPLYGRAEQAIADGLQCLPAADLAALGKAWQAHRAATAAGKSSPALVSPVANLGGPWGGMFAAVTVNDKALYVWLADGSDPNRHEMEAATRGMILGVNPWQSRDGVRHVIVRNFIFRYAATHPQRAAVWLHGRDNTLENCLVEQMAGAGVSVSGTMRRVIVRACGHTGGGAQGDGFLNEDCLWEGNSWKPISRGWDCGGYKLAWANGGVFRRCVFRRNGGDGLWFDIHVRNVLVTECVFIENEGSGLFIEISRDIRAVHNLALRNGVGVVGAVTGEGWGNAGIKLAESMNCIVAHNTCVGNKDGITLREQGPRPLGTEDFGRLPYHNAGHVIVGNVCAANQGYQLGLWYDNAFFGWHPGEKDKFKTVEAWEASLPGSKQVLYVPTKVGLVIDRNLYQGEAGKPLVLYGAPWRPKHKTFKDLAAFAEATGFDARSRSADPGFVSPATDNYRMKPYGEGRAMDVGWAMAPEDIPCWIQSLVPALE
jgi:hypothetical protein